MKNQLIVYYGRGEGKTSAAIGHAIRASKYGKVGIIQFMKKRETGERILKKFKNIDFYNFGKKTFFPAKKKSHREEVKKAFELAAKFLSKKYFLVILDEILYALEFNLLKEKDLLNLLENRKCHVIITGKKAGKKVLKIANIVTEFKKKKHHYDKDKKTIRGIDF